MVDKLHEYEGPIGRLHEVRDDVKSAYSSWKENHEPFTKKIVDNILRRKREPEKVTDEVNYDIGYIRRRKTRWELTRLCAVVMGIEFAYAAITAFSGPILLEIGIPQGYMSFVFTLSPILGFFISPISGSLSDRCTFRYGRRRIFMLAYAVLEIIGLILVPWGTTSDATSNIQQSLNSSFPSARTTSSSSVVNVTILESEKNRPRYEYSTTPTATLILAIVAIVMADFCADALQNPSRAYLLDVCNAEDHTRGLSSFTILAGLGGTVGYLLGSIDWDQYALGHIFGGQIKTVFRITTLMFAVCLILTITTFPEVPLKVLLTIQRLEETESKEEILANEENNVETISLREGQNEECYEDLPNDPKENVGNPDRKYGSVSLQSTCGPSSNVNQESAPSWKEYLASIVALPYSLRILLLTNVLCWMSHVSYSLYFTDYVGEEIFGGSPEAPLHSPLRRSYEEGIRFACLGLTVYSFSCMTWSLFLEKIIEKFGLRVVYITNLVIDAIAMLLMYELNSKFAVICFSFASGIIYCTLFTIPYIVVARYHTLNVFEVTTDGEFIHSTQVRGLGTDVSVIGNSVFIAQFLISLIMGPLKVWYGSTNVVPVVCSFLSLFAALTATQVVYLDL